MGLYIQLIPRGHPNGISLKSGICIMNNDGEFNHMASVQFILEPAISAASKPSQPCCSTISEVQGLRMRHLMLRWHFSTPSGKKSPLENTQWRPGVRRVRLFVPRTKGRLGWRTRTVSDLYVPRCWMVRSKVIQGIVLGVISTHHKHVDPACASHLANSDLVSQLGLYIPFKNKEKTHTMLIAASQLMKDII
jgi:hypothetical protein